VTAILISAVTGRHFYIGVTFEIANT